MNDDFIKMATYVCPVCNKEHSRDPEILIDKRLKTIKNTKIGLKLCEDHYHEDYIVLIVTTGNPEVDPDAKKTGDLVSLKRNVAPKIFKDVNEDVEFAYIDGEVFEFLKNLKTETDE